MTFEPSQSDLRMVRTRIRIRGAVQGVGFRPHVRLVAMALNASGWVKNDGEGVLLEAQCADPKALIAELKNSLPPLARIDSIDQQQIDPARHSDSFDILESSAGPIATRITPDATVCDDCLSEMFDPGDRRYLYPFLNCTHCGPRFTITAKLPYDRVNTSMAQFEMCEACAAEYANPDDRRYHAQPTACPACGPQLSHGITLIVERILAGDIVALKGIGGFHLVCDARNEAAVEKLRQRKNRDAKPFAVMAANLASVKRLVYIDAEEENCLKDTARPILLSARRTESGLAAAIAPGLRELGVMLPYAPLHYLLFHQAAGAVEGTDWLDRPNDLVLVMTSANPGGEPLVIENDEAHLRLSSIADLIVTHDRDILIRADDSVVRVIDGAPAFIRRARGYTPHPIRLPAEQYATLALGAHLKSTICVTRGDEAFVSQHIGDLDTPSGVSFLHETVEHMLSLLDVDPECVACDLHPDFQSTRYAEALGKPVVKVQHHHAHVAALAAEYRVQGPVLGLSLDGYGFGENGEAWGGELILHEGATFQRLGRLRPIPLPGGETAARQPWRLAAGVLSALGRGDEISKRFEAQEQAQLLENLLVSGDVPETSSCGRLFDAAAGLLGVSTYARYEAEPAMLLETLCDGPICESELWRINGDELDLTRLLGVIAELNPAAETDRRYGANLFHGVLLDALAAWAQQAASRIGVNHVALSGGCMLNRVLGDGLPARFRQKGLVPLFPRGVPPGDGAISLGQALIAGSTPQEETLICA